MRYQLEARPKGQYAVIDTHTGRVCFVGSLDGARNAQSTANYRNRSYK